MGGSLSLGFRVGIYMGGCQNYGPFLGPYYNTAPIILGTPKRDHNFDNYPYERRGSLKFGAVRVYYCQVFREPNTP